MPDPADPTDTTIAGKIFSGTENLDDFLRSLDGLSRRLPVRIDADPKTVEQGLAKLVLTLVNLLRQLMERQAIRRMEGGSLTDEEIEQLGQTFMKLEERLTELKTAFGLRHDDLNLDLGPLGKLL
jgi:hypothetical protein